MLTWCVNAVCNVDTSPACMFVCLFVCLFVCCLCLFVCLFTVARVSAPDTTLKYIVLTVAGAATESREVWILCDYIMLK